jgi:TetR/AcrR family transcriptional regulator, regulator of cefoperazone and chloramphenicol sensitivity
MTTDLDSRQFHTRRRLLEAAGEVFAERGFRAATIRDICKRADANIAAVNYHFGDKDGLYAAVLTFAHRSAVEEFPIDAAPGSSAEQRLFHFVHAMLRRMLNTGRPAWHGKLMAREMVEPTAALDLLVKDSIRPQSLLLEGIVRELLGPDVDADRVHKASFSVVGQCVFYRHCKEMLHRLSPQFDAAGSAHIEALARHIAEFSIAGIAAIRNSPSRVLESFGNSVSKRTNGKNKP